MVTVTPPKTWFIPDVWRHDHYNLRIVEHFPKMDESHEGYKISRGVRLDIKKLLTDFEKTESVRFTDFCQEWKKMNFSLIFRERKSVMEILEFTEEVIHIAKGYLEPPWNFHTRVGALFTLYGLYFKQPIVGATKIRFTKEEWRHLCQFIKECKDAHHYDICFIHYKLFAHGAYVFTVVPRTAGLERGFRKYELKSKGSKNVLGERILKRSDIIDQELLDSLAAVETVYLERKSEILGKKNLDFADSDFANELKIKLGKFQAEIQQRYPTRSLEESVTSCEGTSSRGCDEEDGASPEAPPEDKSDETIFEKELKLWKEGRLRGGCWKRTQAKSSDLPEL